jgi:MYXO-CTERM domain-containing protein
MMTLRRNPRNLLAFVRSSHALSSLCIAFTCLLLRACTNVSDTPESLDRNDSTLTGRFEHYVVDHADGSYRDEYALLLDNGQRVELVVGDPELSSEFRSGDRVKLAGRYVSNAAPLSTRDHLKLGSKRFAVERVSMERAALGSVAQGLVAPPKVTVTAAVVLLNFNGMNPQGTSADELKKDLGTVKDYYLEMSYGTWTMSSDVFGPFNVDAPAQCDLDTLGNLGKATLKAQGVDIDSYDHIGVKIGDFAGMTCPCGVAYLGTTPAEGTIGNGGVSLYQCGGANTYAHEMGHGIGLSHSSTAPCDGVGYRPALAGCDIIEYGNRFNTMGGGLGHFNAMQKATLGWLNGCNIRRVSADGEFDLTAIQLGVDDQTQGLQIDTGDQLGGGPLYFYVEYRNPALAKFNALKDNGDPRERGPGLHVSVSRDFRAGNGEGRTILIDSSNGLKGLPTDGSDSQQAAGDPRMLPGDTFKPNDKVSIQFVSQTDKVAHVKISFAGGGSGTNECQSSAVPAGPPTVPDGFAATLFQDCDYKGQWSANLPEGKYTTGDLQALGVVDNDSSSLVLAPGYDALLYVDDNFGGQTVTRHTSLSCFTKISMNDALSSIEIVSNGMGPGPDAGMSVDGGTGTSGDGDGDGDSTTNPGDGDGTHAGDGDAPSGDGDSAHENPGDGDGSSGGGKKGGGCSVGTSAQGSPWLLLGLGALLLQRRRRRSC